MPLTGSRLIAAFVDDFAIVNALGVCVFSATFRLESDAAGSADQMHPSGLDSTMRLPGWLDCSSALLTSPTLRRVHASIGFCAAVVRVAIIERSSNRPVLAEAMRCVVIERPGWAFMSALSGAGRRSRA